MTVKCKEESGFFSPEFGFYSVVIEGVLGEGVKLQRQKKMFSFNV